MTYIPPKAGKKRIVKCCTYVFILNRYYNKNRERVLNTISLERYGWVLNRRQSLPICKVFIRGDKRLVGVDGYVTKEEFNIIYVNICVFMAGCATTISNLKSIDDLKGKKLLVGRFIFYINGLPIDISEKTPEDMRKKGILGFSIFIKKRGGKTKTIEIDENGYVYIPVDYGQYYLTGIRSNYLINGRIRHYQIRSSDGISVNKSDKVVNFGITKVKIRLTQRSMNIECLTMIFFVDIYFPELSKLCITQTPDFNASRKYISLKFGIPPETIRDEIVKFPEKL